MSVFQKWSQCKVSLLKPSPEQSALPHAHGPHQSQTAVVYQGLRLVDSVPFTPATVPSSGRAVTISLAKCLHPNEERKSLEIQMLSLQVLCLPCCAYLLLQVYSKLVWGTAALAESAAGAITLPALALTTTGVWLLSVPLPLSLVCPCLKVFYFQILFKLA